MHTTQHILDGMNVVVDVKGSDVTTFTRGNGLGTRGRFSCVVWMVMTIIMVVRIMPLVMTL